MVETLGTVERTIEERIEFLEETAIANLKDFFACSALLLFANDLNNYSNEKIALKCYNIAEAMLKERAKRGH